MNKTIEAFLSDLTLNELDKLETKLRNGMRSLEHEKERRNKLYAQQRASRERRRLRDQLRSA